MLASAAEAHLKKQHELCKSFRLAMSADTLIDVGFMGQVQSWVLFDAHCLFNVADAKERFEFNNKNKDHRLHRMLAKCFTHVGLSLPLAMACGTYARHDSETKLVMTDTSQVMNMTTSVKGFTAEKSNSDLRLKTLINRTSGITVFPLVSASDAAPPGSADSSSAPSVNAFVLRVGNHIVEIGWMLTQIDPDNRATERYYEVVRSLYALVCNPLVAAEFASSFAKSDSPSVKAHTTVFGEGVKKSKRYPDVKAAPPTLSTSSAPTAPTVSRVSFPRDFVPRQPAASRQLQGTCATSAAASTQAHLVSACGPKEPEAELHSTNQQVAHQPQRQSAHAPSPPASPLPSALPSSSTPTPLPAIYTDTGDAALTPPFAASSPTAMSAAHAAGPLAGTIGEPAAKLAYGPSGPSSAPASSPSAASAGSSSTASATSSSAASSAPAGSPSTTPSSSPSSGTPVPPSDVGQFLNLEWVQNELIRTQTAVAKAEAELAALKSAHAREKDDDARKLEQLTTDTNERIALAGRLAADKSLLERKLIDAATEKDLLLRQADAYLAKQAAWDQTTADKLASQAATLAATHANLLREAQNTASLREQALVAAHAQALSAIQADNQLAPSLPSASVGSSGEPTDHVACKKTINELIEAFEVSYAFSNQQLFKLREMSDIAAVALFAADVVLDKERAESIRMASAASALSSAELGRQREELIALEDRLSRAKHDALYQTAQNRDTRDSDRSQCYASGYDDGIKLQLTRTMAEFGLIDDTFKKETTRLRLDNLVLIHRLSETHEAMVEASNQTYAPPYVLLRDKLVAFYVSEDTRNESSDVKLTDAACKFDSYFNFRDRSTNIESLRKTVEGLPKPVSAHKRKAAPPTLPPPSVAEKAGVETAESGTEQNEMAAKAAKTARVYPPSTEVSRAHNREVRQKCKERKEKEAEEAKEAMEAKEANEANEAARDLANNTARKLALDVLAIAGDQYQERAERRKMIAKWYPVTELAHLQYCVKHQIDPIEFMVRYCERYKITGDALFAKKKSMEVIFKLSMLAQGLKYPALASDLAIQAKNEADAKEAAAAASGSSKKTQPASNKAEAAKKNAAAAADKPAASKAEAPTTKPAASADRAAANEGDPKKNNKKKDAPTAAPGEEKETQKNKKLKTAGGEEDVAGASAQQAAASQRAKIQQQQAQNAAAAAAADSARAAASSAAAKAAREEVQAELLRAAQRQADEDHRKQVDADKRRQADADRQRQADADKRKQARVAVAAAELLRARNSANAAAAAATDASTAFRTLTLDATVALTAEAYALRVSELDALVPAPRTSTRINGKSTIATKPAADPAVNRARVDAWRKTQLETAKKVYDTRSAQLSAANADVYRLEQIKVAIENDAADVGDEDEDVNEEQDQAMTAALASIVQQSVPMTELRGRVPAKRRVTEQDRLDMALAAYDETIAWLNDSDSDSDNDSDNGSDSDN